MTCRHKPNCLSHWGSEELREYIQENTCPMTSFSVFWELEAIEKGKPWKAISSE